jgi:3-deoxy-D-manno-octulosonate 8-phosphate phosphatase (KDO 8-P phosphatase)
VKKTKKELQKIAKGIQLLILDVDGVLTDGKIILDNEGNEFKAFHVRDGHGIKMLVRAGVRVAIITGRQSKVVELRARELGITDVYQKCYVKTAAFEQIIGKYGLTGGEVAYVGDDIVDIPVFRRVGLPVAVNDAAEEARNFAALVTKNGGGRGAVREICDFLLRAKGLWETATRDYFET